MNRYKAAGVHLAISLALALAAWVFALLYFLWFPSPHFVAAGAGSQIGLLIGVDLCIGPLLTLVVVNAGKSLRECRMDLSVIGLLQLMALVYGIYVIAQARPVFVVARADRLVLVSADQLSDAHSGA